MLTTSKVHSKIKEISRMYLSGNPSLHIQSLAQELKADVPTVREHITALETLRLVAYHPDSAEVILLTEKGRITTMP
jgi:Mn-dependent DtxR family transcriptional regulator